MQKQNIATSAAKAVLVDIIGDVLYFPVWWYTAGFKHIFLNRLRSTAAMADHLALRLLLLNIFKPMFGQYDRAGRLISFFMRIVILIVRFIWFVVYWIIQVLLVALWLLFPAIIIFRLIGGYIFATYVN